MNKRQRSGLRALFIQRKAIEEFGTPDWVTYPEASHLCEHFRSKKDKYAGWTSSNSAVRRLDVCMYIARNS